MVVAEAKTQMWKELRRKDLVGFYKDLANHLARSRQCSGGEENYHPKPTQEFKYMGILFSLLPKEGGKSVLRSAETRFFHAQHLIWIKHKSSIKSDRVFINQAPDLYFSNTNPHMTDVSAWVAAG